MDIKCVIVDDEPPALDELSYILSQIPGVEILGTADSAANAINTIRSKQPHLVFLDIKMPGQDGFEVIKVCNRFWNKPLFVLATAYDEHAVKAFDACAVDYILKPFNLKRIQESVERVRQLVITKQQGELCGQLENLVTRIQPVTNQTIKISVENKGRIRLLDPGEIVYFKAESKEVTAYTERQAYPLHGTASLHELEFRLKAHEFFRSHRSYLVNLGWVGEVVPWFNGKYILTVTNSASSEVPVSRRRVKLLKQRLIL